MYSRSTFSAIISISEPIISDTQQLKILYQEVTLNIKEVQKSFEELLVYHNKMILEKMKFISQDLPELESKLESVIVSVQAKVAQTAFSATTETKNAL